MQRGLLLVIWRLAGTSSVAASYSGRRSLPIRWPSSWFGFDSLIEIVASSGACGRGTREVALKATRAPGVRRS